MKDIICIWYWQGLGSSHFHQWGKASPEERREIVQAEVWQQMEKARKAKAVLNRNKWDLPKRRI